MRAKTALVLALVAALVAGCVSTGSHLSTDAFVKQELGQRGL